MPYVFEEEAGVPIKELEKEHLISITPVDSHFSLWQLFSSKISSGILKKELKKNFMAPFYGWGSTASRLEPLRGGSLLFTSKFPDYPGILI